MLRWRSMNRLWAAGEHHSARDLLTLFREDKNNKSEPNWIDDITADALVRATHSEMSDLTVTTLTNTSQVLVTMSHPCKRLFNQIGDEVAMRIEHEEPVIKEDITELLRTPCSNNYLSDVVGDAVSSGAMKLSDIDVLRLLKSKLSSKVKKQLSQYFTPIIIENLSVQHLVFLTSIDQDGFTLHPQSQRAMESKISSNSSPVPQYNFANVAKHSKSKSEFLHQFLSKNHIVTFTDAIVVLQAPFLKKNIESHCSQIIKERIMSDQYIVDKEIRILAKGIPRLEYDSDIHLNLSKLASLGKINPDTLIDVIVSIVKNKSSVPFDDVYNLLLNNYLKGLVENKEFIREKEKAVVRVGSLLRYPLPLSAVRMIGISLSGNNFLKKKMLSPLGTAGLLKIFDKWKHLDLSLNRDTVPDESLWYFFECISSACSFGKINLTRNILFKKTNFHSWIKNKPEIPLHMVRPVMLALEKSEHLYSVLPSELFLVLIKGLRRGLEENILESHLVSKTLVNIPISKDDWITDYRVMFDIIKNNFKKDYLTTSMEVLCAYFEGPVYCEHPSAHFMAECIEKRWKNSDEVVDEKRARQIIHLFLALRRESWITQMCSVVSADTCSSTISNAHSAVFKILKSIAPKANPPLRKIYAEYPILTMSVDIAITGIKVVIEIDGVTHFSDPEKRIYNRLTKINHSILVRNGWKVIRIPTRGIQEAEVEKMLKKMLLGKKISSPNPIRTVDGFIPSFRKARKRIK